jgi:hypothetical protein
MLVDLLVLSPDVLRDSRSHLEQTFTQRTRSLSLLGGINADATPFHFPKLSMPDVRSKVFDLTACLNEARSL